MIFWNVPELERENVLNFLRNVEIDGYDTDTIHEESELMTFEQDSSTNNQLSRLTKGKIQLSNTATELDKECKMF